MVMRGCKRATSMNEERISFPSLSTSAVLCLAVRAGQLSRRKKMINTTAAMNSAISVKASGQDIRLATADFDIGRWAFSVGQTLLSKRKRPDFRHQKITAPHTRWA